MITKARCNGISANRADDLRPVPRGRSGSGRVARRSRPRPYLSPRDPRRSADPVSWGRRGRGRCKPPEAGRDHPAVTGGRVLRPVRARRLRTTRHRAMARLRADRRRLDPGHDPHRRHLTRDQPPVAQRPTRKELADGMPHSGDSAAGGTNAASEHTRPESPPTRTGRRRDASSRSRRHPTRPSGGARRESGSAPGDQSMNTAGAGAPAGRWSTPPKLPSTSALSAASG